MKKVIVSIFICLMAVNVSFAQKGSILINGNLSFYATNTKSNNHKDKTRDFRFAPGIGYRLTDNFLVGLKVGYFSNVNDPEGDIKTTNKGMTVGPYARYYYPLNDIFSIYGQFDFLYTHSNEENVTYFNFTSTQKNKGCRISVSPHINAHVGKGWSLNFGFGTLGFDSITSIPEQGEQSTQNTFGMDLNGSSIDWGVSYTFGGAGK
ncbi:MAG: outer membrane beta-barrel protein [Bacteroidetes bacterium]|jgi:hypothetical protein|nr:outer membrane beta-barrel protein [Bacteroidota bacterium]